MFYPWKLRTYYVQTTGIPCSVIVSCPLFLSMLHTGKSKEQNIFLGGDHSRARYQRSTASYSALALYTVLYTALYTATALGDMHRICQCSFEKSVLQRNFCWRRGQKQICGSEEYADPVGYSHYLKGSQYLPSTPPPPFLIPMTQSWRPVWFTIHHIHVTCNLGGRRGRGVRASA